uniref:Eukaryotic translation initiation factor 3 subunit I n=1 Tax=Aceria tosichella TaxID=561515 RepID=A0A6G1SGF4_9ACAR
MRPIALHGHTRALTRVRFNREGDLVFSAAKDCSPVVWYSSTGQRIGNYEAKLGVIWDLDVDFSTTLIAAAGSEAIFVWDAETGKTIHQVDTHNSVRACGFSFSGHQILYTTDSTMKLLPKVCVMDIRDPAQVESPQNAGYFHEESVSEKVSAVIWGPLDQTFLTGNEKGAIKKWDIRKPGEVVAQSEDHTSAITDLQGSADCTMFISSSKDCTAKLFDIETLEVIKTYQSDRPVNSASISPLRDHVVLGGGQEAMEVTTTAQQSGKFEAQFYHMIFEEEFARVKGHFGPINTIAFHPDGRGYASGSEDGYVRVHRFDPKYFEYEN